MKTVAAGLLADPGTRQQVLRRFEREAQAAARVDHANVATVHDADVVDETCWLAMQLVDGATLDLVLGEQPGERFDVATAAAVAAQVCSGLSAAHAAGLVHRDLKPQNIMIRRDGVVKILDFGLVKVASDAGVRLTETGEHLGNIVYASPELLSGRRDLDGRSDLYSVGCLLHEMLTGAPPFPPEQPALLVSRHLCETPPTIASCGIDVPPGLQRLVDALLTKDRGGRPASAADVYAALGPFLPRSEPARASGGHFAAEDPLRPFVLPQGPHRQ
ncbi:serine/threonine protein kinase [Wenjunlia vitaminophila]|uniref:non-specific serine/threonine protein kinase n=1 Tax=Wenjunlia vitaminophila TaxID=76728 RepID=A0A0T6LTF5_WENVI|nr:serine/threonine protein kinase [Wenjunlia vitaminophila]